MCPLCFKRKIACNLGTSVQVIRRRPLQAGTTSCKSAHEKLSCEAIVSYLNPVLSLFPVRKQHGELLLCRRDALLQVAMHCTISVIRTQPLSHFLVIKLACILVISSTRCETGGLYLPR